jgi:hypothetical protein
MPPAGRVLPIIEPFDFLDAANVLNVECTVTRRPLEQQALPASGPTSVTSALSSPNPSPAIALNNSGNGSIAESELDPLAHLDSSFLSHTASPSAAPSSSFSRSPGVAVPSQRQQRPSQAGKQMPQRQNVAPAEAVGALQQHKEKQVDNANARQQLLEEKLRLLQQARQALADLRDQKNGVMEERFRVEEVICPRKAAALFVCIVCFRRLSVLSECSCALRMLFHRVVPLLPQLSLQLVRDAIRKREVVERDIAGVRAQERRFREEISRKQQLVVF